ncbi:hypothetical protein M569_16323, partial [Genlisea aurea]
SDDFCRTIARIAVAQVCDTVGFDTFHESALDSLADIAIRFIGDLGRTSRFYANLSGRTECNVFDIIEGLDSMGFSQDSTIGALQMFVETAEEIPFPQSLPKFPLNRLPKLIPSFHQIGETPKSKHIPPWLPAFPDPHTYVWTPVWNERATDPRTDKIELARQHRKAERSLLNLQRRLLSNGSSRASPPADDDDDDDNIEANGSPEPEPGKNKEEKRIALVEAFGPAIDAMKERVDSGSDNERVAADPSNRAFPVSRCSNKKAFFGGEPLDLRIRIRNEPWFGRADEKDDKRRRVEFILKQSKQNQQELSQL